MNLAFLCLLGGAGWFVCFSPFFEVKMVSVSGDGQKKNDECEKILRDLAEKKVAFLSSKSIFLFDLDKANREILEKFPQIQNVKIERKFPGEIYASVQERKAAAIYAWRENKFYSIDETGVIFEEMLNADNSFTISKNEEPGDIKLGDRLFDTPFLVKILRFKTDMENRLSVKAGQAVVITDERVNFRSSDGWEIFINPQKDMDWQFTKLEAVVNDAGFAEKRENLEYVDLRFTRVYIKSRQSDVVYETEAVDGSQNQTPPADLKEPVKPNDPEE